MLRKIQCDECGNFLRKDYRYNKMVDFDEDMTEGQMADYFAAQESRDAGEWNTGIEGFICDKCGYSVEYLNDQVDNYDPLIKSWHQKANSGDYFSRYVFQYLSFTSHLNYNLYIDQESDRRKIQRLKSNDHKRKIYLQLVHGDEQLRAYWKELIKELSGSPLQNTAGGFDYINIHRWWNCEKLELNQKDEAMDQLPNGTIHSLDDWINMVEFWHSVRNNFFHGGKAPNVQRDQFLVELALRTLRPFMEIEIQTLP